MPWRWASRARLLGSCVRPAGDPRPWRPRGAPPLSPGAPGATYRGAAGGAAGARTRSPGHRRDRGPEGLGHPLPDVVALSPQLADLSLRPQSGTPAGRGRRCSSAILCAGPRPSSCRGRRRDGRRPAPCAPGEEAASPRARAAPAPQPAFSPGAGRALPARGAGRERQLRLLSLRGQLGVVPVQTPLSLEPSSLSRELRDPPLSLHHFPGRLFFLRFGRVQGCLEVTTAGGEELRMEGLLTGGRGRLRSLPPRSPLLPGPAPAFHVRPREPRRRGQHLLRVLVRGVELAPVSPATRWPPGFRSSRRPSSSPFACAPRLQLLGSWARGWASPCGSGLSSEPAVVFLPGGSPQSRDAPETGLPSSP